MSPVAMCRHGEKGKTTVSTKDAWLRAEGLQSLRVQGFGMMWRADLLSSALETKTGNFKRARGINPCTLSPHNYNRKP